FVPYQTTPHPPLHSFPTRRSSDLGQRNARQLGKRLKNLTFASVFTSPLQRAMRTCELAGFQAVAEVDHNLVEWDYGQYEGRRSADRKSTRLNSSHDQISYAVFCLK